MRSSLAPRWRTWTASGGEHCGYEQELLGYATPSLEEVPGLRLVDTAPDKAAILSFVLDGYRPEDVGSALKAEGIAVRAGHRGPFGQRS
jgi:selenocysteine lyase/cysteine desulfurase